MSCKTTIYCEIRFCKNKIIVRGLMTMKEYIKTLIEWKWIEKEGKCYCSACIREGLVK